MRRYIIAGNWKMYCTIGEAIELANGLKRELFDVTQLDIVLCPPLTALSEVNEVVTESNIELGAQNAHWEDEGAYTGEVSCRMLKDAGCKYVILGHSERRQYFDETNDIVNKKVKKALSTGLKPIICIGETLQEREAGKTFNVIKRQFHESLEGLSKDDLLASAIAYEPVWAIGTGINATPEQAQEAHRYIRELMAKLFDKNTSELVRIQYGGSVKPVNIEGLMRKPDIDGALVGGASLKIDSFVRIVKTAGGA